MQNKIIESYVNTPISRMHIDGRWHIAMTNQSSDCDAIAVEMGDEYFSFVHIPGGENGDIAIASITAEEFKEYCIKVDLSGGTYRLKKVVYEDGYLDMVVFQSEKDHVHICSSDHNLIINKSIYDLSELSYVYTDPSVLLEW